MNKLTVQDIINFFQESPTFQNTESIYCWPSSCDGLYSISNIYRYFEEKGIDKKEVDEVKVRNFQIECSNHSTLEKDKTHHLFIIFIKNYNPDYSNDPYFVYYYYDITKEKAYSLKKKYEEESRLLMLSHANKNKNASVPYNEVPTKQPITKKKPIKQQQII